MGNRDLRSQIKTVTLHTKAQKTSTQAVQGTDVSEFHGAMFVVDIGTWTADGLTVTFQDSNDNSTWADIAATNLDGYANDIAIKHGHANAVLEVGYTGSKKYIGAKITDAGSGDAIVGIYVVKGYPSRLPQYT